MTQPDHLRVKDLFVNPKRRQDGMRRPFYGRFELKPDEGVVDPDHWPAEDADTGIVKIIDEKAAQAVVDILKIPMHELPRYEKKAGIFIAKVLRAPILAERIRGLDTTNPEELSPPVLQRMKDYRLDIREARYLLAEHPYKPDLATLDIMTRELRRKDVGVLARVVEQGVLSSGDELNFQDPWEVAKHE